MVPVETVGPFSPGVKVNKSVYIALSGQWHDITLNSFFLHLRNHTLIRFLIKAFIYFINDSNTLFNKNIFSKEAEIW